MIEKFESFGRPCVSNANASAAKNRHERLFFGSARAVQLARAKIHCPVWSELFAEDAASPRGTASRV